MHKTVQDRTFMQEYSGIEEFYKYLCDTPFNDAFRWSEHSSVCTDWYSKKWTKTENFEQATEMLKNGWDDMAKQLKNKMVGKKLEAEMVKQCRNVLAVAGYQPVVPLYLAGVPQNMVAKKMVPVKQKVVNITKSLNYSSSVSSDKIIEESIKVMQLVKRIEQQGMKCNIYIALGTEAGGRKIICKVKIKGAAERLNVSKLAFPLVHPSMLRRLMFRYIEVCPDVTKAHVGTYGYPVSVDDMKRMMPKDVVLPAIWGVDVDKVKNVEEFLGTV